MIDETLHNEITRLMPGDDLHVDPGRSLEEQAEFFDHLRNQCLSIAKRLKNIAAPLPHYGMDGDRKCFLELRAAALEEQASRYAQKYCDLIERQLESETLWLLHD